MDIAASEAIWLLPPALPVALFIAYGDLKFMKITNAAVLLMAGIFLFFGFIALPFYGWLWQIAQMLIMLLVGILAHGLRLMGGGDAKYLAAIAGFVAPADVPVVLILFAVSLLAAFTFHRLARAVPFVRRRTPDWKSWESGTLFPMGLALSGTLIAYLFSALVTVSPA